MLIGEISRRSGLSKDGIRHYEALGLIHSQPVQAGTRTYRDYLPCTWERLALIALAKRVGFGLKELSGTLDQVLNDELTREERSAALREKVEQLDLRIAELQKARHLLAEFADMPEKPFVDKRLKEMGLWLE